ncbi:hypothetical protein HMPREF9373_0691 [Psychrobacter sp. 1501(2011)]|nr:hypothetical protein HMPREF9373_0691 [Psychrobacter sp. 1501(2011)]
MPKKVAEVKNKRGGLNAKKMLENNIIVSNHDSKLNQDEYIINPNMENDLYKFLDSGLTSPQINEILESM